MEVVISASIYKEICSVLDVGRYGSDKGAKMVVHKCGNVLCGGAVGSHGGSARVA